MTTDDQVCVALLDDVAMRQVLATRDEHELAMIVRLNLAACGVDPHARLLTPQDTSTLIATGDPTVVGPSTVTAAAPDQWRSQRPTSSTV